MVAGFCERAVAAGLPLGSLVVVLDTLHPTHEGHAVRWRRNTPETIFIEYARTNQGGEAEENWQRSTFYQLFHSGETYLRGRLTDETVARYYNLDQDRDAGMKEFLGVLTRFGAAGTIGDMDCLYSAWYTDLDRGFNDERDRGDPAAGAVPGRRDQERFAGPGRAQPRRNVSGARRQPAGAERADRARRRGPDRGGAVVQRPQRLHQDHRNAPGRSRSSRCSTTMRASSSPPSASMAETCSN